MPTLYTIGHSNRTFPEYLKILQAYDINYLVDVRTIPKSRYVPWANLGELKKLLKKNHIAYEHCPELGGLRKAKPDSINLGWHNASFRGYADYMQTKAFYEALKHLNSLLHEPNRVVIQCAEAVPWRCHRSLIGDAEVVRGIKVIDILSATNSRLHTLHDFAVVDRSKRPIQISYPEPGASQQQLEF
jgi:uncharacterized protein (DUF488 family)